MNIRPRMAQRRMLSLLIAFGMSGVWTLMGEMPFAKALVPSLPIHTHSNVHAASRPALQTLHLEGPGIQLQVTPNAWVAPPKKTTNSKPSAGQAPLEAASQVTEPLSLTPELQLLVLLTILSLAPAILVLGTAFTRVVIVLAMVRQALGTPQLPPNQVLIGLALILTFFIMAPTVQTMQRTALKPYMAGEISQPVAMQRIEQPLRQFMFRQTNVKDLGLFVKLAKLPAPKNRASVPTYVLLPAFVISELKTAFQLGFLLFLPFLIIDLAVSSILVSMGMMFLPPATISLPFKIILFVLVDGWHLLCQALILGYQQ
ncbi:MAG: flagellar type III secretion system pore protein FliP [Vampirovibrionales bacterium]